MEKCCVIRRSPSQRRGASWSVVPSSVRCAANVGSRKAASWHACQTNGGTAPEVKFTGLMHPSRISGPECTKFWACRQGFWPPQPSRDSRAVSDAGTQTGPTAEGGSATGKQGPEQRPSLDRTHHSTLADSMVSGRISTGQASNRSSCENSGCRCGIARCASSAARLVQFS